MFDVSKLRVRLVEPSDAELLWQWANDPVVRKYSFSPEEIPFLSHMEWFQQKLSSPSSRIYMIELEDVPIGQARYDRVNANEAEIDISVASDHRVRGLGTLALVLTREIARKDLNVDRVVGVVMTVNAASCAAFRKAGFVEQEPRLVGSHPCRLFYWPPN